MKKWLVVTLAMLCLTGCNQKTEQKESGYLFTVNNEKIALGEEFSKEKYGTEKSFYELSSCAFEGNDKVYEYEHFEITTFGKNEKDYVLSIYFLDPTIQTSEGLAIGDMLDKMIELYGENYQKTGSLYEYKKDKSILRMIVNDDVVSSIEYSYDIESEK